MSGAASSSVAVGVGIGGGGELGYGGYRAPFTPVQWQELEHQAMIYKYLMAGLPVPPDLVMPIRRSFDAISARFFHHPSLGYCSYYGKKFDPEPGRCRRTDGKKWRCSKDAHPDSKYCERHMHRGRNRSRKPVESQSTSQSVSTATSHISSGCGNNSGSFHGSGSGSGSGSFQNMPFYSVASSDGSSFGSNVTKLQMEPISYGIDNKDFRYIHGVTPDAEDPSFSLEASASVGSLGLGSSAGGGTWRLMPSQVSSSSIIKQKSDSQLLGPSSTQQNIPHTFEPILKQRQHCFLGSEIGSPVLAKQEQQHPIHPFFSEWPTTKESWSTLDDDDGSSKNLFSSTQLSISIPRASTSFSSSGYSTQGESNKEL
ncbi:growth-regulating factor 4-like isoform X2 [Salvia miltiorrhiza]|uniref:growth-regulating factor 4-like isoform X2 n=1 Tax=Salvia miltiorrhiza TaxID=226208 RepID=UPI0025AD99C2|nr:growth-regulating factor 4-like isoform X2 [Salvia miltiorrhiza]